MSVTGVSFTSKQECYILDYVNENCKSQANHKNSTSDVKMKEKFIFYKMQKKSVTILIGFVFGLACASAFLCFLYLSNGWTKHCSNALCDRSAQNLLSSINQSVNPCDDFYEFACGNWIQNHKIPKYQVSSDWFDIRKNLLLLNISNFLRKNDSEDEPFPVHQARMFYRSCILQGEKKNSNFSAIEAILEELDLPVLPSLIDNHEHTPESFSWVNTVVFSKRVLNEDFFVSFSISSDPKNRTINKIHISKPSGISSLSMHRYDEKILRLQLKNYISNSVDETSPVPDLENLNSMNISDKYTEAFIDYVTGTSQYVARISGFDWVNVDNEKFNETLNDLLYFHVMVDEYIDFYYANESVLPTYITIDEFQTMIDDVSASENSSSIIDWKNYFQLMFATSDTNITLDFDSTDSEILISDIQYLTMIFDLLTKTSPDIIEFYLWLKVLTNVAPYTNKELSKFNKDFLHSLTDNEERPRNLYCAGIVDEMLGLATAYSVANDHFMKEKIEKIAIMVDDIQSAFTENIKNVSWIDDETKNVTVRKINAMKKYIGFPKWLNTKEGLDDYYSGLTITKDNFLDNILNKIQTTHLEMLEQYRMLNDFDQEIWISNPMEVNAFNYLEGNTITIPAGILQFPFCGQGLEALNYGSIGSIIGHEVTHSFDNTGKEYDENGNTNPWWTNETITKFQNRTACFVDYYGSFSYPESPKNKVNGKQTLDENIADNGGLRSAFIAYKKYVKKHGVEPALPNLEKYTSEQLFYLGFANTWCEHSSELALQQSLTDTHSPNKVRVLGTLSNSDEFAQVWQCKPGTPMNPRRKKCNMW